ncbi:hypothetical protein GGS20DRAFT_493729 [Poronia punctata]|nr:hypothetical protein GGS20DRAFT_493729 [Poronia punctata]
MAPRMDTHSSNDTASSGHTRRSSDSYDSQSTAPSSLYDESPRPSTKAAGTRAPKLQSSYYQEDLSPITSLYPRSSVETYSSRASYEEVDDDEFDEDIEYPEIPPLPIYDHDIEDVNVRPSTPEGFAALFPSLNKLIIRHDDLTPDGNMNLRVDTVVYERRRKTIQLFHLRMRDLNKREFSLRRYCRESGREVCNSKRKYIEANESRYSHIPKSVTTAVKTLAPRPMLRRMSSSSLFTTRSRPGTSHSMATTMDELASDFDQSVALEKKERARLVPSNVLKLEFSNYARVDLRRRGHKVKKYEFEWWEHTYNWRRVVCKLTGTVSYHLFRDDEKTPVAHMVPENRSPNQIAIDEYAGGWVPPYHMWMSDESLINVTTDVADVVVATGLMALVDDCIKTRWQPAKNRLRRFSLPEMEFTGPRSFVQQLFQRRNSEHHQQRPSSPLRSQRVITTY